MARPFWGTCLVVADRGTLECLLFPAAVSDRGAIACGKIKTCRKLFPWNFHLLIIFLPHPKFPRKLTSAFHRAARVSGVAWCTNRYLFFSALPSSLSAFLTCLMREVAALIGGKVFGSGALCSGSAAESSGARPVRIPGAAHHQQPPWPSPARRYLDSLSFSRVSCSLALVERAAYINTGTASSFSNPTSSPIHPSTITTLFTSPHHTQPNNHHHNEGRRHPLSRCHHHGLRC